MNYAVVISLEGNPETVYICSSKEEANRILEEQYKENVVEDEEEPLSYYPGSSFSVGKLVNVSGTIVSPPHVLEGTQWKNGYQE